MGRYAIFDLDGCLSDDRHRLHLIEEASDGAKVYSRYHESLGEDAAMNLSVLRSCVDGGCNIIFLTSRPEHYRTATENWIEDKLAGPITLLRLGNYKLFMRSANDRRPSPTFKVDWLETLGIPAEEIKAAFDDRKDVLAAYKDWGVSPFRVTRLTYPSLGIDGLDEVAATSTSAAGKSTTADLLRKAADTMDERNADYKDNWRNVPEVVKALFPEGLPYDIVTQPEWHLFELMIVKLTRFANSDFNHQDSIHDLGVYAFMIESILEESK